MIEFIFIDYEISFDKRIDVSNLTHLLQVWNF